LYWRGKEEGNLSALCQILQVIVGQRADIIRTRDQWNQKTVLINRVQYPAVMVHLKIIRDQSGDRILPVLYSDNYLTLMPGEEKLIQIELEHEDTRGEQPVVIIEGLNVK